MLHGKKEKIDDGDYASFAHFECGMLRYVWEISRMFVHLSSEEYNSGLDTE